LRSPVTSLAIPDGLRNRVWSALSCSLAGLSVLMILFALAVIGTHPAGRVAELALLSSPVLVFAALVTAIVGIARHEGVLAVVGLVASLLLTVIMVAAIGAALSQVGGPIGLLPLPA
jgi:hypothetical protein